MKKNYNHKFILFDEKEDSIPSFGEGGILLYPFRNMSAHSFSFPFSGISRVRDALMIQFRPLLGDGAGDVSVIPFFVNSEKKLSSGCVFTLFGGEAARIEESTRGMEEECLVWPAPLAFAAEVDGNGIITWTDGDRVTAVWLDDWIPVYYKTADVSEGGAEHEAGLALAYALQMEHNVEKVFAIDKADLSDSYVHEAGLKTLSACPAYALLDLSDRGTNLLERREKLVTTLTGAGRLAVACGFILLLATGGVYIDHSSILKAEISSLEEVYSAAFNETSRQPLVSALSKIRTIGNSEVDVSFNSVMRGISSAWDKLEASGDISIDTLRYGGENTDVSGAAKNNESIQRLRSALEAEGFTLRTDNMQVLQIPGGDMLRFSNLTISRSGK